MEWISHLELGSWSRFCVNRTWFDWLLVSFLRNSVFLCVLLEQGGGGPQVCGAVLPFGSVCLCLELLPPSLLVPSIYSVGQII